MMKLTTDMATEFHIPCLWSGELAKLKIGLYQERWGVWVHRGRDDFRWLASLDEGLEWQLNPPVKFFTAQDALDAALNTTEIAEIK